MQMARRLALALAALLLLAVSGSALAQSPGERQRSIDREIDRLRDRVDATNERQSVLTSQISRVTSEIRGLQDDIAGSEARLTRLQVELAVYEDRLARLTELLRIQTNKLRILRGQHFAAQRLLERRLIAIYESDDPSAMAVVLSGASFGEMLDHLDFIGQIGSQDQLIARQAKSARDSMARARANTSSTRVQVAAASEAVRARTVEQAAVHAELLANREALGAARWTKRRTLAARIRASQAGGRVTSATPGSVSASGFIWPVSGYVTSGFGWRWGRMHEGVDIGASAGTPIMAAAGGTVIYAGWLDGYGSLVVVDHGGGVATAYAHMSSIGAGVGQGVGQGQVIGWVGCTGHCFGDHLHFEIRLNGAPVDPLAYL